MKSGSSLSRRDFLRLTGSFGLALGAAGLVPLSAFGRSAPEPLQSEQQTRLLMGTLVTITITTPEVGRAQYAMNLAFAEMERLIAIFDRRNSASALSTLNDQGRLALAPPELVRVLAAGARLSKISGYAFNPAITPVVDLFEKAALSGRLPRLTDPDFAEALALASPGEVRLDARSVALGRSGMRLTLDGIAKGYIVDAASEILSERGFDNHMVNAGGDIRVQGLAEGNRPWNIGIQHPDNSGAILAATQLKNGGIATSGNYEKAYNRSRSSHHIISHLTGKSADVTSVTVKARDAMQADALATTLALMAPAQALRYVDTYTAASCLIYDRQGRRFASANWG